MSAPRPVLVIPAWNEAERLPRVLAEVAREAPGFECVVVDDGSLDATARVAEAAGARVLRHPFNLGYGAALQTGYRYALARRASLVVQMDADGQHDAAQIERIAAPVRRGECDLCIGSRFLGSSAYPFGAARQVGRALLRAVLRGFGLDVTDPTSGFQAMNAAVLGLYVGDFFPADFPDVDVLLVAHRAGVRIAERGVRMRGATRGSTLHGGLRPLYYAYKMGLAIWAASRGSPSLRPPPAPPAGEAASGDRSTHTS